MHKATNLKTLLAAMVMGAFAALSAPAHAANDAMMELLKILKEKGSITAEEHEALVNAARADAEAVDDSQNQLTAIRKNTPTIATEGKLEFVKPDKEFSWRIGGRAMMDAAWYNNDGGTNQAGSDTFTSLASGTEFRRARLDVTATVWKAWGLKLQYDFTDSGQAGFRDVYLRYNFQGAQPGSVTIGKFKEAFSLDELTSSNDDPFMEQALTEVFYPSRRLGIAGTTYGHDMWTATLGVFGEDSTVTGNQPSCSASVSASSGSVTTCTGNDSEGWAVTGRLTFSPIHTPASDRVVHLGFAGSHRMPDDGDAIAFSSRPESRIARDTLIASGSISGVDSVDRYGFEAAGNYGPASLQGEYYLMNVNRESAFGDDLSYDGFYVMGSYILTGEFRPYKFQDGTYSNPKPSGVVGKGGIGAWELVARYSHLDLEDTDLSSCATLSSSTVCGTEDNVTVGLNWYPTQNFKFMAHYVQVLDIDGGVFESAEPGAFQVRSQFYW